MDPLPLTTFRSDRGLRAVVCGPGCVRERLAPEIEVLSIRRPLIVCGERVSRSPVMAAVRTGLGRDGIVYDGSRPHTPVESVDRGAEVARAAGADGIVAVGGSSAVDCAKGIAVLLASGRRNVSEIEPLDFTRLFDEQRAVDRRFPVVVVSTTLSFAEMLPFWGARHVALQRKLAYPDLGCVERTVFLDGEMAVHTPSDVWLETGVKALDDAVAAWCRGTAAEPFLDPLLAEAIRLLVERLPASGDGGATAARQDVLVACWMTKQPLPRLGPVAVAAWLSTTARHALGAVRAVGHGAGSCVALGHALRFHAPATRSRQAALASRLGWRRDDDAPLAAGVAGLLDTLRVPRRLRDVGVGADALPGVVAAMRAESPGLGSSAELLELCERML